MRTRRDMNDPGTGANYKPIGASGSTNTPKSKRYKSIGGVESANTDAPAGRDLSDAWDNQMNAAQGQDLPDLPKKRIVDDDVLVDFDELARTTLLAPIKAMTEQESSDAYTAKKAGSSSFAFKSTTDDFFYIKKGTIKVLGYDAYVFPEDGTANKVQINGGTKESPYFVSIRLPVGDNPNTATLVCTSTDPVDDGSYRFYTLYEAYLVDGKARCGQDKRTDFCPRSPL